MNIFKYDIIVGDCDSEEEKAERRRWQLEAQRNRKINDLLGIEDEGQIIVDNRDKVIADIIANSEKKRSIITRIKDWF